MKWLVLVTLMAGCRTEDVGSVEVQDTQGLTEIGDVAAMADAWCSVLACRDGFEDGFDSVEACVSFYTDYWGNPLWDNNQRECFEDTEVVDACTAALLAAECGGEPPTECEGLLACDDPDDTE